jgi:hypothetical protein
VNGGGSVLLPLLHSERSGEESTICIPPKPRSATFAWLRGSPAGSDVAAILLERRLGRCFLSNCGRPEAWSSVSGLASAGGKRSPGSAHRLDVNDAL